jgi:hypothetical protein
VDLLEYVLDFLIGWPLTILALALLGWAIIWGFSAITGAFFWGLAIVCPPFRRWRDSQRYWAEH